MKKMNLYHGSVNIVKTPKYGVGKLYNDYGMGFYCTEHIELAKEWASTSVVGGYANQYVFDTSDLNLLDLTEHHVLSWLAVLIQYRTFDLKSPLGREAKEYLKEEFLIDLSEYDVIRGYRADDSYFAFATGFLNGMLSLEQLSQAMKLGDLGEQVVIKSEKGYQHLQFEDYVEVEQKVYYKKRMKRDQDARVKFQRMKSETKASESIYMLDIIRERWRKDDVFLSRRL